MNNQVIKIGLSILLLLCLADMPYGYFQFVRFVSLIGFAVLAYQANEQGKQTELIIYCSLALLFQPFFKISLGRTLWNIVDVIVAVGMLLSLFNSTKEK
jgi:hypothetical protein